jgi:hypothetical protein
LAGRFERSQDSFGEVALCILTMIGILESSVLSR